MSFTVQAEAPPLREDAHGVIRVGETRVLLELVIRAFEDGATPEAVVQRYPSLALPDVYAAIAYFLRHRGQVEEYLKQREHDARETTRVVERPQGDLSGIRARLNARRQQDS